MHGLLLSQLTISSKSTFRHQIIISRVRRRSRKYIPETERKTIIGNIKKKTKRSISRYLWQTHRYTYTYTHILTHTHTERERERER